MLQNFLRSLPMISMRGNWHIPAGYFTILENIPQNSRGVLRVKKFMSITQRPVRLKQHDYSKTKQSAAGLLFAYIVAGHHGGLLNYGSAEGGLCERLQKEKLPDYSAYHNEISFDTQNIGPLKVTSTPSKNRFLYFILHADALLLPCRCGLA